MLISLFFVHHSPPGKLCTGWNFRLVVKFRDDLTNSWARVKPRVALWCTVKSRLHPKREWSSARSKSSVGTRTARHNGRLIKIPGCILCSRDGGHHLARRYGKELEREEAKREREREREPGRGIGGVRKGEGHATLSGPRLNLATSTPTLANRCGYIPLDASRAHFTASTSSFILSPASFALFPPLFVNRSRAPKFSAYERRTSYASSTRYHTVSSTLNDMRCIVDRNIPQIECQIFLLLSKHIVICKVIQN